ncbi:hypothetical protein DMC47_07055 [Nostoc sp. 3335mG]|nr:hypothetical protein DMC47_07055 [Nostoc sp. 3335mG]
MSPLARLLPNLISVSLRERLRSSLGAFVGLLATALLTTHALGHGESWPLLMAPIGASAVLLFAVPASPLAQPWSILGGNCTAAVVGVTCAQLIGDVALAAALAVSISIGLMLTLKCLHPPSGAVALTAVIGGTTITDLGYVFVAWPVAVNSLLLLAVAIAFNRLTGKDYPHRPVRLPSVTAPSHQVSLGVTPGDLEKAIRERDEVLSVDPIDLEEVLQRAEVLAFSRRSGGVTAGAVMTRTVATVAPGTSLRAALRLLREQGIKALPVIDEGRRVAGILTQTDLLDKADWGPARTTPRLGWRLPARTNSDRPLRGKVRDVMTPVVSTVAPAMPLAMVVQIMLRTGHHHLPVVADDSSLVGMVTQSDVVAALFHVNAQDLALAG